jgi:hypothetical protein
MRNYNAVIFLATFLSAAVFQDAIAPSRPVDSPLVTFVGKDASSLEAIVSVGIQSRSPIGIIFGKQRDILCAPRHPIEIKQSTSFKAVETAVENTGYRVKEEGGVIVIAAPDLTAEQKRLLTFRYSDFPELNNTTMAYLGAQLTGWMRMEAEHVPGYMSNTLSSTNAERVSLKSAQNASTEEIANRIVSLGSKGVWTFRATTFPSPDSSAVGATIEVFSYEDNARALSTLSCDP